MTGFERPRVVIVRILRAADIHACWYLLYCFVFVTFSKKKKNVRLNRIVSSSGRLAHCPPHPPHRMTASTAVRRNRITIVNKEGKLHMNN